MWLKILTFSKTKRWRDARHTMLRKPKQDGKGKKSGGDRASVTGDTKEKVVQKTVEIAKKQDESSVVIHKADGVIQEERQSQKVRIQIRRRVNPLLHHFKASV